MISNNNKNGSNKWREAASVLVVACLLALVAAADEDTNTTGLIEEKPDEWTSNVAIETTTIGTTEEPAAAFEANGTADEVEGASRSVGGEDAQVYPWLATLHGEIIVHHMTMICALQAEVEEESGNMTDHSMYLMWPAKKTFDDTNQGGHILIYKPLGDFGSFSIVNGERPIDHDVFPSPGAYPKLAQMGQEAKDNCVLYTWNGTPNDDARVQLRNFVKMTVTVLDCCSDECRLKVGPEWGLCGSHADLGYPVMCNEILTYIVSEIDLVGCSNTEFKGRKVSGLASNLGHLLDRAGKKERRPVTGSHPRPAAKGRKQVRSGRKKAKQGTRHRPRKATSLSPAKRRPQKS